ncbi:zinc ribbon domain-containing protein YjdM, partial [Enterococcus faecalis]|uniref:zinc ribbon domain-containing protein YjdM n=1 Tax=Enterococcus faecalis TaxID=1351 RepID=UPI0039A65AB4
MTLPTCPECGSEYTYEDRGLLICPECGNEWSKEEQKTVIEDGLVVLDANGNRLSEGDSVTVIKDLKVKGASGAIKQGTKPMLATGGSAIMAIDSLKERGASNIKFVC